MRADLLLKVAADPRAVTTLTTEDICELLAEDRPPAWVFDEAARRTGDERVMAHLFSHPAADPELLRRAVRYDLSRCERFNHHVAVYTGPPPTLTSIFSGVVPEVVSPELTASQEHLLVTYLSPLCLAALRPVIREEASTSSEKRRENETDGDVVKPDATTLHLPRGYAPSARFLLLGDFLYYLTCAGVETPHGLPVLAKVALALNDNQPSTLYLEDADVRVRVAARERMERELNWHELTGVVEAHEAYHNYRELRRFCDLYYPTATRIVVQVVQAYDDNTYYNTFGPSNLTAYDGDKEVHLPTDDVALLVLLAASAELKDAFGDAKPERPIDWLEEQFHDDVYNLELCGIDKGYDVEVDLTSPPPLPRAVYVKEGDEHAVLADG